MKRYIIILMCLLLISCNAQIREPKEYTIKSRYLNNDNTYTYRILDDSIFESYLIIRSSKRFNIKDKVNIKISGIVKDK